MAKGKLVLLTLAAVGAYAVVRRRRSAAKERLDLYFADGSMLALEEGSFEADRLLPLAREVLSAARGNAR